MRQPLAGVPMLVAWKLEVVGQAVVVGAQLLLASFQGFQFGLLFQGELVLALDLALVFLEELLFFFSGVHFGGVRDRTLLLEERGLTHDGFGRFSSRRRSGLGF